MPVVEGVPETAPVEELIDMPTGRPEAVQVNTAPDWVSVAEGASEAANPVRLDVFAWAVTTTELLITQEKAADPAWPVLSRATMTTEDVPGVVGVPEIVPVAELIATPAGRPLADHVMVAPGSESVELALIGLMADPVRPDWLPGLTTVMVDEIPQVKDVALAKAWPSVAVTVTG